MSLNLTLGDTTGTPPTDNVVKLYDVWDDNRPYGLFPSNMPFQDDELANRIPQLDGVGVIQYGNNDYRMREMTWNIVDMDIHGANFSANDGFVYALKQKIYKISGSDYFLGYNDFDEYLAAHNAAIDVDAGSNQGTITKAAGNYTNIATGDRIILKTDANHDGVFTTADVTGAVITTSSILPGGDDAVASVEIRIMGAHFLPANPIEIRIVDIITIPIPNNENRNFQRVTMKFHQV